MQMSPSISLRDLGVQKILCVCERDTHIHTNIITSVAQTVKNLPAMQETHVRSLGHEDPLEKGMETTPVFLPGEFHGQRNLMGYSPWSCKESDTTEQLTQIHIITFTKSVLVINFPLNT